MPISTIKTTDSTLQDKYFSQLEKLSRSISTPLTPVQRFHTRWFFESVEGQYEATKLKEGYTAARLRTFETRYPQSQIFNKKQLALYLNAYKDVTSGKKIVVGPHIAAGSDETNWELFIAHNIEKKTTSVYFEDAIAKIILYKAAELLYPSSPNVSGGNSHIIVPYAVALLNNITSNQIDLYQIWKAQDISQPLKELLVKIMSEVEALFKKNAPDELINELAQKEETWIFVKKHDFKFDLAGIAGDLVNKIHQTKRIPVTEEAIAAVEIKEQNDKMKSIPSPIWKKIEDFGYKTKSLSEYEMKIAYSIAGKVRNHVDLLDTERETGLKILDIIIENAPELLAEAESLTEKKKESAVKFEVSLELISKVVKWDKKNKRLKNIEYTFMSNLAEGISPFTENNKTVAKWNIEKAFRYGFTE